VRIAHLTQARDPGGLRRLLAALASEQSRSHQLLILTRDERRPELPASVDWEPHRVGGNTHLRAAGALRRQIARFAPDAVCIHAASPGEGALAAAVLSRRFPTIVVEHAPEYYPGASFWRDRALFRLKGRAQRWVAVSEAGARALEERARLPAGRIGSVWSGVAEPDDARPGAAPEIDPGVAVMAFARPVESKGYDTFVQVARSLASRFPHARWLWVGADRAERDGAVERVPWTPVGWLMRRAACVAIPSRAEGLPLVLLEAWACATPVVASRVGGIPEVAQPDRNALLVDPEDGERWGSAIARLLDDPELRQRLGSAGRHRWESTFTARHMATRYQELLSDLRPQKPNPQEP
jgi:glycosyltransferase involved in cell wall biosynthesis